MPVSKEGSGCFVAFELCTQPEEGCPQIIILSTAPKSGRGILGQIPLRGIPFLCRNLQIPGSYLCKTPCYVCTNSIFLYKQLIYAYCGCQSSCKEFCLHCNRALVEVYDILFISLVLRCYHVLSSLFSERKCVTERRYFCVKFIHKCFSAQKRSRHNLHISGIHIFNMQLHFCVFFA